MEDNGARNIRLRQVLLQRRAELLKESRSGMNKCLSGEDHDMAISGDDGDRSVTISAEDINFRKLAQKRASIRMIEEALLKLDSGSYGICEECGEEIPEGRLTVMPFALHCRGCQELIEERRRVQGSTFSED